MVNFHGIVPSIIKEVSLIKIDVQYPDKSVDLGTNFTLIEAKSVPQVKWDVNPGKYYTLFMIDPDAPSKSCGFLGQVNHWLVGNIQGCDLETGEVLATYLPPGAPRFTGFHRYILVVFEHDEKVEFDEKIITSRSTARFRWNLDKFMKKYKFEKVHAWNYFQAEWCASEEGSKCTIL